MFLQVHKKITLKEHRKRELNRLSSVGYFLFNSFSLLSAFFARLPASSINRTSSKIVK